MKLFSVSVAGMVKWKKVKRTYYVIQETKELATDFVLRHLRHEMTITRVALLGHEYGTRFFGPQESPK